MHKKIKDLPIELRPREKLKELGVDNLTNIELLSIILKNGIKGLNVEELSTDILNNYKLSNFKDLSLEELIKIKGIGEVKAIELVACIELGKRIFLSKPKKLVKLSNPKQIFEFTKYLFTGKKQEMFYCMYFNNKQELISKKLLFVGTLNKSITHPREVFKEAYKLSASTIVCLHNHPSNDTTPSTEDNIFTNSLVKIGHIQGIPIIDHIIVGEDNYYSYLENNKL